MKKYCNVYIVIILTTILFTTLNIVNQMQNSNKSITNENILSLYRQSYNRDLYFLSQEALNIDYSFVPDDMKNHPILVYAYSGSECGRCVFEDLESIKTRLTVDNQNKVIVYAPMPKSSNEYIMLNTDLEGIRWVKNEKLRETFPIDKDGNWVRYFSLIMPDGKIILPFFPMKNFPEKRDVYLDFIFLNYLNIK